MLKQLKKYPIKQHKIVKLETDFAGIKAGAILFVATREIIEVYMHSIPFGECRTIHRLRNELARKYNCDATCPVSTAIFIRLIADKALIELHNGKSKNEIAPFWRLIEADSKIAKKLEVDSNWIELQREIESS
jgi:hypothetical protein